LYVFAKNYVSEEDEKAFENGEEAPAATSALDSGRILVIVRIPTHYILGINIGMGPAVPVDIIHGYLSIWVLLVIWLIGHSLISVIPDYRLVSMKGKMVVMMGVMRGHQSFTSHYSLAKSEF
jgi:hypothetical protein